MSDDPILLYNITLAPGGEIQWSGALSQDNVNVLVGAKSHNNSNQTVRVLAWQARPEGQFRINVSPAQGVTSYLEYAHHKSDWIEQFAYCSDIPIELQSDLPMPEPEFGLDEIADAQALINELCR